ncbi:hypothetical protein HGRIS_011208 [Hohenbuehelia grisea]|uniref:Uncharacterized protein n=1 Tax=Hohenbuehelia grisea TaxID=104357 RepID=A0ABR3JW58_9AGAR
MGFSCRPWVARGWGEIARAATDPKICSPVCMSHTRIVTSSPIRRHGYRKDILSVSLERMQDFLARLRVPDPDSSTFRS